MALLLGFSCGGMLRQSYKLSLELNTRCFPLTLSTWFNYIHFHVCIGVGMGKQYIGLLQDMLLASESSAGTQMLLARTVLNSLCRPEWPHWAPASACSLLYFEQRSHWTWSAQQCKLEDVDSKPSHPPVSSTFLAKVTVWSAFYVKLGDPDAGPHAWMINSLLTDPSLQHMSILKCIL